MLIAYKKVKAWCIIFISVFFLMYVGFHSDWNQKKFFYPYPYKELVMEYAAARQLDSNLIAGVILAESKFDSIAQSSKGAVGLMQIMPKTALWIAGQLDNTSFVLEDLCDPEVSINFGTWYLSSLRSEFENNEVLMLAAYNAGRGNVKEWMEIYQWDMSFNDVDQIPFNETRRYVKKVLKSKEKYKELYAEDQAD